MASIMRVETFNQPGSRLMGMEALCDGTIRTADGGTFPIHCAIVAWKSDYFKVTIKGDFNQGNVQRDILVTNITAETMRDILIYMYTENTSIISAESVGGLLTASDFLSMPCLYQKCRELVSVMISPVNCFELLNVAYFLGHLDLYDACHRYAQTNFNLAVRSLLQSKETLVRLEELELKPFHRLISSDLNVDDEDMVGLVVALWIAKDPAARLEQAPSLFQCLRITDTIEELLQRLASQSAIPDIEHCRESLTMLTQKVVGLTLHDRASRELNPHQQRFEARQPSIRLLCVPEGATNELYLSFDGRCDGGTWFKIGQTSGIHLTTVLSIGSAVYLIDSYNPLHPGSYFDLLERTWHVLPPLNRTRTAYTAVAILDYVYCIGAHSRARTGETIVERYERDADRWTTMSALPVTRCLATTALNGRLIALGLTGIDVVSPRVYEYDPVSDSWSPFRVPVVGRANELKVSMVAFDGLLYIFGGDTNGSTIRKVERYDAKTDKWEIITDIPAVFFEPRAVVLNQSLVVYDNSGPEIPAVYWDEDSKEWKEWKIDFDLRKCSRICEISDINTNRELRPMLKNVSWSPSLPK